MIKIDDDFFIEVDNLCYTAKEDKHKTTKTKNGEEIPVYNIIGYYGTLSKAIIGVRDYILKNHFGENTCSLDEAIAYIEKVDETFQNYIKEKTKKL